MTIGLLIILGSNNANSQDNFSVLEKIQTTMMKQLEYFHRLPDEDYNNRAIAYAKYQRTAEKYRALGTKLWKELPKDDRRYLWFETTMRICKDNLHYWQNIDSASKVYVSATVKRIDYYLPVNKNKLDAWRLVYPEYKRAYAEYMLTHSDFHESRLSEIESYELIEYLTQQQNLAQREDKESMLQKIKSHFLRTAYYTNFLDSTSVYLGAAYAVLDYAFFSNYRLLGLSSSDVNSFLNLFDKRTYPATLKWIDKYKRLFSHFNQPIQLSAQTLSGKHIDISDAYYSKKVILLDFWATGCKACINRMPYFKELYEKYKDRGFEVISLCAKDSLYLDRVKEIENKLAPDWETAIFSNEDNSTIFSKKFTNQYAFIGFPRILLLDENKNIILYNNELLKSDCEIMILNALSNLSKIKSSENNLSLHSSSK